VRDHVTDVMRAIAEPAGPRLRPNGAMRLTTLLVLAVAAEVGAQSASVATSGEPLTRRQIDALPSDLPSGTTRSVTVLGGQGGPTLLVSIDRHPDYADELTLWAPNGARFSPVRHMSGPEDPRLGNISVPHRFTWRGHAFLHLSIHLAGTGAQREDEVLYLGPTGDMRPVAFRQAPDALASILAPGEGVWKGAFYEFADELRFEFSVWREGDGNCCPTGGRVTGTYVLRQMMEPGGRRGWVMEVGSFVRHSPEP
jgi:hypothetical protein